MLQHIEGDTAFSSRPGTAFMPRLSLGYRHRMPGLGKDFRWPDRRRLLRGSSREHRRTVLEINALAINLRDRNPIASGRGRFHFARSSVESRLLRRLLQGPRSRMRSRSAD